MESRSSSVIPPPPADTLLLLSGGLDSAVLLAYESARGRVLPVYVAVGLAWETGERTMLRRLLATPVFNGRLLPLETLELSMRDIYAPDHWALRGTPPAYDTPDEDVYLSGRNLVLLAKAGVLAATRRIPRIVLGPLAGNPFPDATPEFFAAMAQALSLGLAQPMVVDTPFAAFDKREVIRLGASLGVALEWTLSCMNPATDDPPRHCGLCSKCRERRDGFAAAGVDDRTAYAHASPR